MTLGDSESRGPHGPGYSPELFPLEYHQRCDIPRPDKQPSYLTRLFGFLKQSPKCWKAPAPKTPHLFEDRPVTNDHSPTSDTNTTPATKPTGLKPLLLAQGTSPPATTARSRARSVTPPTPSGVPHSSIKYVKDSSPDSEPQRQRTAASVKRMRQTKQMSTAPASPCPITCAMTSHIAGKSPRPETASLRRIPSIATESSLSNSATVNVSTTTFTSTETTAVPIKRTELDSKSVISPPPKTLRSNAGLPSSSCASPDSHKSCQAQNTNSQAIVSETADNEPSQSMTRKQLRSKVYAPLKVVVRKLFGSSYSTTSQDLANKYSSNQPRPRATTVQTEQK